MWSIIKHDRSVIKWTSIISFASGGFEQDTYSSCYLGDTNFLFKIGFQLTSHGFHILVSKYLVKKKLLQIKIEKNIS